MGGGVPLDGGNKERSLSNSIHKTSDHRTLAASFINDRSPPREHINVTRYKEADLLLQIGGQRRKTGMFH